VGVFSQDMSEFAAGAYTGEISADMLQSIEADGSIIGHSERRQYHGETDSLATKK
jgi:triosephosphate isomerase